MREHLFRGKRCDNGEFTLGFPFENFGHYYISPKDSYQMFQVVHETVGEFTGLTDKNGVKIFEHDILLVNTGWYKSAKPKESRFDNSVKGNTYWSVEHKIYNCEMGFMTFGIDRRFHKPLTQSRLFNVDAVVTGNIFDNPELLKEASE